MWNRPLFIFYHLNANFTIKTILSAIITYRSMKYFGSKSEYHRERTADLLNAYFRILETCKHVSMPNVFKNVVNMPASRFWVSASRAAVVLADIMRGDNLCSMRPNKREMYFEIHRRVKELQQRHINWSIPQLIEAVIAQPAPKFYLAPGSARVIILKARKKWFVENSRRLRRC